MFIKTVSHTLKKRAHSLMISIIIILIFWRINSWAASVNRLIMQLTFALLLIIVLILIFSIITLTIEQTTTYIKRKKVTQVTIFFKCINVVELSFIKSTCIFFLIVQWFFFLSISFLFFRRWCCKTFVWTI